MDTSIDQVRQALLQQYGTLQNKADILKAPQLKALYKSITELPLDQRKHFGRAVNDLRLEFEAMVQRDAAARQSSDVKTLDVTAPFDINVSPQRRPSALLTQYGTIHPLTRELQRVVDIFTRMGFEAIESRQLDSDWNMFGALNFPEGHPARDGYDTFRTEENLLPPAHTSTMQNRVLKAGKAKLERGEVISTIIYGRCYRNEDTDTTHEHTFHQVEGVYVSDSATLSDMLGILRTFFEVYYGQKLKVKTQPAYFPFVEPGLEFAIEKPKALQSSQTGNDDERLHNSEWLEMLGCGMIHPNVLRAADIDPAKYRGFAWGGGIERLVMLAYNIEDVRLFASGKLQFLRQF